MRNLKRVLSLALALVMVLGMMVITTSAAKFDDAEEITYTEAVDVMSAIGVITGDNGNFYPNRVLTREEGAAFICYMLMGKDNADKLGGSGNFADVKSDRWSAGEIDYCNNLGIILGYTDAEGKQVFNPKGELTGIAFGRMLLGALGYDGKVEGYTGANWASAIAADMIEAGLVIEGVAMDAVLTREAAAQMAFQALEADMVWYPTGKGTDINFSDGTSVSIGAGAAAKVTTGNTLYADGGAGTADAAYQQFCEKYFPNLNKEAVAASANGGLAGYFWFLNKDKAGNFIASADTKIGTYTTESITTSYASGTKYVDIAKDLGVKNDATKTYTIENYTNKTPDGVQTGTVNGATIYSTYASNTVPNGVTVDVVVTANGTIRLMANVYYLGVIAAADVTKDTNNDDVDDRAVNVNRYTNGADDSVNYTLTAKNCASFEEIFAAASALKGPNAKLYYVIQPEGDATASTTKLLTITEAASMTGKLTSATASSGVYTINGAAYKLNVTAAGEVINNYTADAVFYLDNNGFILYTTATPGAAANYAFMEDVQVYAKPASGLDQTAGYYMQAKLVMPDGTTKIVDVESAQFHGDANVYSIHGATGTVKIVAGNMAAVNTLADTRVLCCMTYTVNEDGTYNLVEGNTAWAANGSIKAEPAFAGSLVAYDNTTFVVRTGAGNPQNPYKYATYTGYANLPVDKSTTLTATVYGNVQGNVFFLVGASNAAAGDAEYAYITSTDYTYNYVNGSNKDTYVFKAIVNGAETTVTANATTAAILDNGVGMYQVKYTEGVITAVENSGVALAGDTIATAAKNGTVVLTNGGVDAYNADTVIYVIERGAVTVGDITEIPVGATVYVQYVKVGPQVTNTIATVYYAK